MGRHAQPTPQQSSYGMALLFALGHQGSQRHVYGGTVPQAVVDGRRARNRVARASRRTNRKAGR